MIEITHNFLDSVNEMLKQAIFHGGDNGGPYFSEADDLEKSVKDFIKNLGAEEKLEIFWYTFKKDYQNNIWYIEEQQKLPNKDVDYIGIRFKNGVI